MEELRASFPGMPVYVALGNNDTGCGDYQLDAGSSFLAQAGKIVAEGLPPSQQQASAQGVWGRRLLQHYDGRADARHPPDCRQ